MHDRAHGDHAEIEPADMPRASEPGWADLLTELARFTAMPDRSKEETLLDAVGTVVRLRALVAERDARIAALEAGLQRFVTAWDAALEVADGRASFHYGHLKAIADTRTEWRDYEEAAWLFGLSAETR